MNRFYANNSKCTLVLKVPQRDHTTIVVRAGIPALYQPIPPNEDLIPILGQLGFQYRQRGYGIDKIRKVPPGREATDTITAIFAGDFVARDVDSPK